MYRILIAEDEPIERAVLVRMIRNRYKDQLEIMQAENGRIALEVFMDNPCQIVLLDIEMPGLSGLEAARKIREQNEECKIIFLTAFDEFSYAREAILVRALDYLVKPSSDEELFAVLDEAIHQVEAETKKKDILVRSADKKEAYSERADSEKQKIVSMIEAEKDKTDNIRIFAVRKVILNYIEENYQKDISLQDAARTLNYAEAYFCKIFRHCFDSNFTTFLSNYRVEKAKQLLEDISINVKEISDLVGYHDSNYFTKVFKRIIGETPSEYRIKALKKGNQNE